MNRLLFCLLVLVSIASGCMDSSRSVSASRITPVIVAFGDSLTAGLGVNADENYPSKLQARIDAQGYHYRVVNAGISGETTQQGLRRVESVCALKPAIVIVEFGANDRLHGLEPSRTGQNLLAIVRRLQDSHAVVIVAGTEMPPEHLYGNRGKGQSLFSVVSVQSGAYLIPLFLEGVSGQPHFNQKDGRHPNAKGYDLVLENVWEVLQPLLRSGKTAI